MVGLSLGGQGPRVGQDLFLHNYLLVTGGWSPLPEGGQNVVFYGLRGSNFLGTKRVSHIDNQSLQIECPQSHKNYSSLRREATSYLI